MKLMDKPGEIFARRNWWRQGPTVRFALLCIFLVALALFAIKAGVAVNDPFFGGDAGHRMRNADFPIARLGNRVWLPVLQGHIWVFYLLRLPYYAFKFIPCFYFFLVILSLGIISYKAIGRTCFGFVFTLLLMLCLGHQDPIAGLGIQLYQEIIGTAFFYLLLLAGALELRKSYLALALGGVALMVRDSFWIYLFAFSLLHWKTILFRKGFRHAFILLWAVPALWLLSILVGHLVIDGRLPMMPAEWPLMMNTKEGRTVSDLSTALASLWTSLSSSRILFLIAGLVIVQVTGLLHFVSKWNVSNQRDSFGAGLKPFSLLSLGIIYGLLLLFNPYTFGNPRMAAPMVEHAYVWAIILFGETLTWPATSRILARAVLVAGLLLSVNPDVSAWLPKDNSGTEMCHARIERVANDVAGGRRAGVCIVGVEFWDAVRHFVAPTIYERLRMLPPDKITPEVCDLVISGADSDFAPGEQFTRHGDCRIEETSYVIYRRRDPR